MKQLERMQAASDLLDGQTLPTSTRQLLMERACQAWSEMDHADWEGQWIENGYLNALDGSDDGRIAKTLAHGWFDELEMPKLRELLKAEVQSEYDEGCFGKWSSIDASGRGPGSRSGENI